MWLTVLTLLVGLTGIIYLWTRKKFSYFKSIGIAEDPGYFPLGSDSSWKLLTGRLAFPSMPDNAYLNFPNEKVVGTYGPFGSRLLVVRDLEIAKNVLVKDFDHFVDRRSFELSKNSNRYFHGMLTVMTGEKWKTMRGIMSPVFTSGKLKLMMPTIHRVGDEFVGHLENFAANEKEFDAKYLLTSFTLDVISSAGLGVEANSFKDPDSLLRKKIDLLMGANNSDPYGMLRTLFIIIFPKIAKFFDLPFINAEASEFIVQIIRSSLEFRKKEKIRKNDFIDIMLDALKEYQDSNEPAASESYLEGDSKRVEKVFTPQEIESALISNALLLFFAGFDTTSNSMAITSYYLATNPEVQDELFREIEQAVHANGGDQNLDYNTIQTLQYLDQVVNEGLRVYPLAVLERLCVKDYKIPGVNFVVPKGMLVQIASPNIMVDEKYFPNPERFDPDNFSPENKSERSPYTFLAFGQGPRSCIGMRFALLQVKTAIARMVYNYRILGCDKTVAKLVCDPMSRSMMPKGGIWIQVKKRNQ